MKRPDKKKFQSQNLMSELMNQSSGQAGYCIFDRKGYTMEYEVHELRKIS